MDAVVVYRESSCLDSSMVPVLFSLGEEVGLDPSKELSNSLIMSSLREQIAIE